MYIFSIFEYYSLEIIFPQHFHKHRGINLKNMSYLALVVGLFYILRVLKSICRTVTLDVLLMVKPYWVNNQ